MRRPSVHIIGSRGYPSYYGGFETLVRHLAPFLVDAGWDVTVFGRGQQNSRQETPADERVRCVDTKGFETQKLSTLSFGLSASARTVAEKPDAALVLNVANGYWLPFLKARGIPTLVNVDGIEWERDKWGASARRVFRAGARLTARYADELVFDSQALGARWAREFARDGVFIPYGGTSSQGHPCPEQARAGGYILAVARFVPENTIHEFLDAATQLSERWPVLIVGSSGYGGPIEERVQQLVDLHKNIHWLGHIADDDALFGLWEHAGTYFHGHSVGGTNPALVQAMALGSPTVARDTTFNREVLQSAGRFAAPDPQSIVDEISRVMTDPALRSVLSSTSIRRAVDLYSWESVCTRYEHALRAAIGSATPTAGEQSANR